MRLVARWCGAVVVSAAGFALAWWICGKLIGLDEGVSLGVAGAVLAVLLAVAAWWAPRGADSGGADGSGGRRPVPEARRPGTRPGMSRIRSAAVPSRGRCCRAGTSRNLTFGASPAPPLPAGRPGRGVMAGDGGGETRNSISGGTSARPGAAGPGLQQSHLRDATRRLRRRWRWRSCRALVSGFTGREAELAQVAGLLDPAGGAGAVVVSAVAGLAGVGKTALAIQAGHAARAAGWFPGGVLFIDLHGYDDGAGAAASGAGFAAARAGRAGGAYPAGG